MGVVQRERHRLQRMIKYNEMLGMLKKYLDCKHGCGWGYVVSHCCCHTWNHTLGILIQEIPFLGTLAQTADEHNELEFAVWQNTHYPYNLGGILKKDWQNHNVFSRCFTHCVETLTDATGFCIFQSKEGQLGLVCPRTQGVIWYTHGLMGTNSFNLCNLHFKTDSEIQVLLYA